MLADNSRTNTDLILAAQLVKCLLFDGFEQRGLNTEAHVADFVQEQRSAVSEFEEPVLPTIGPCVVAFFITEQLRFQQMLGDCGAVDFHKKFVADRAVFVNGPGDDFLTCPRFAANQNRYFVVPND